jgi:hypothetical protein
MRGQRRHQSGACQAQVALTALHGAKTVHALATEAGGPPGQLTPWQRARHEDAPRLFARHRGRQPREEGALNASVDQPIGQRTGELAWWKKPRAVAVEATRQGNAAAQAQRRVRW